MADTLYESVLLRESGFLQKILGKILRRKITWPQLVLVDVWCNLMRPKFVKYFGVNAIRYLFGFIIGRVINFKNALIDIRVEYPFGYPMFSSDQDYTSMIIEKEI